MPYERTSWRFTGSEGWDVTIVGIGMSRQTIYFRDGDDSYIWQQDIRCGALNLGYGAPVSLNFAPRSLFLPSYELGPIRKSPRVSGLLTASHFGGRWMILSINAGLVASHSFSMVLFGADGIVVAMALLRMIIVSLSLGDIWNAERAFRSLVNEFNGFGFIGGMSVGFNMSIGPGEAYCRAYGAFPLRDL